MNHMKVIKAMCISNLQIFVLKLCLNNQNKWCLHRFNMYVYKCALNKTIYRKKYNNCVNLVLGMVKKHFIVQGFSIVTCRSWQTVTAILFWRRLSNLLYISTSLWKFLRNFFSPCNLHITIHADPYYQLLWILVTFWVSLLFCNAMYQDSALKHI